MRRVVPHRSCFPKSLSQCMRRVVYSMQCVGAIDQGTQSTRFYLFDKGQKPLVHSQVDLPPIYPTPGWCEHNPWKILESVHECIQKTMKEGTQKYGQLEVVAVGITNQRETLIVWDKNTGQPLYNAIVWFDNRNAQICHEMQSALGSKEYFRSVSGLPISTYFSAFKFKWLLQNVVEVQKAAEEGRLLMGTVDSWLIYNLTGGALGKVNGGGVHATDVSNASRTALMDLRSCDYHEDFMKLFGVNADMLPLIKSCCEVYGHIAEGPLQGVPISGVLGDQQAALLGQRCKVSEVKNTYGTGCFLLMNTGEQITPSTHGLLTTIAFKLGPNEPTQYALEGSIGTAGSGISWLQDNLGIIGSAAESETLASKVEDTAGVYFVPGFSGLLAPYWRDDARGAVLGLSAYSTSAHICRAMLESICFQTCEVVEAMEEDAGRGVTLLRVDGGASKNNLLMQLQSDLASRPVLRPQMQETTSQGAALAAGLGVGFWTKEDVFGIESTNHHEIFQSSIQKVEATERIGKWRKAVEKSFNLDQLDV